MHWFHHVADMSWVTLLWAGSFLVFVGGSWVLTRKSRRARRREVHHLAHSLPAPRPSA